MKFVVKAYQKIVKTLNIDLSASYHGQEALLDQLWELQIQAAINMRDVHEISDRHVNLFGEACHYLGEMCRDIMNRNMWQPVQWSCYHIMVVMCVNTLRTAGALFPSLGVFFPVHCIYSHHSRDTLSLYLHTK